jgi:chemotaxis protein methyltransferase CheR
MTAELTPVQFGALSALVHRTSGIHLHQGKLGLVRSRLAGRLRELGIADPDAYFARLNAFGGELEVGRLVDALTTNKTGFFREPRHFELLRQLLPGLRRSDRRLALWSAGCSSGEEPYSLAMTALDVLGPGADVRILATDISARMLAHARQAIYPQEALEPVPPVLRQRSFTCRHPAPPRTYAVREEVRGLVRFARLNLVGTWPMRRSFDLVWCRNVMIYFDKATQQTLVQRFWERLVPGGYLFTGHSESLAGLDHGFRYVQPAVYQRVGA